MVLEIDSSSVNKMEIHCNRDYNVGDSMFA